MKFTRRTISVIFLFSVLLTGLNGQNLTGELPQKMVINGKQYYLHVIQKGEGLYRISVNYGVPMQAIIEANPDIEGTLKVGQILRIPVSTATPGTATSTSFIYHTVEPGQTAYSLSRKYNVSLDELYKYNPGTEKGLIVGAILQIPAKPELPAQGVAGQAAGQGQVSRPLGQAAQTLPVQPQVQTTPGQAAQSAQTRSAAVDIMPELSQRDERYIYHIVEAGETMYSLSRKYNISMDQLLEYNPALRSGVLVSGSEIRILKSTLANNLSIAEEGVSNQGVVEDDRYLYHTIQPGQTLYSIGRMYQADLAAIKALNPGLNENDLKVGSVIRVPKPKVDMSLADLDQNDRSLYRIHKVKRKETLYGISRMYNVDVETIKQINPRIDFQNLQTRDEIRIPTDAWFARQTALSMRKDEAEPVKAPDVSIYDVTVGCEKNYTLGYKEPIRVALMLPFAAAQHQSYSDSIQVSRESRASSNRNKMFTEFYSGVLLALDTLKKQGISVELSVYDIAPDTNAVRRALRDPSLSRQHLIIGPALAGELPLVSEFSRAHGIPLVYPMSNTNPQLDNNPYLFHINTPDYLVFDKIAEDIVKQASGGKLIVIRPTEKDDNAGHFIQLLRQKVAATEGRWNAVRMVEYLPTANEMNDLINLMARDSANHVIVPSTKVSEVTRLVPMLYGVREQTKANINFYGLSDVLRFQTVEPEQIHALNGTFYRHFGLDYNDSHTKAFISKYRQWYHTEPHAISPFFQSSDATSGFSRYGIWGYDVANYFISAIASYGEDFELCLDKFRHDQVQFNFRFERTSNWGGFYNAGLYKFRFRSDLKMERVALDK